MYFFSPNPEINSLQFISGGIISRVNSLQNVFIKDKILQSLYTVNLKFLI